MRARIKEKQEVAKGTLLDPPYDDEKGPRRHISVTSPNDTGVLGLCTRLRDSAFERSLTALPLGAEVEVEEPKGDLRSSRRNGPAVRVHRRRDRDHCLSDMLRYISEEGLPHRVTLVYSNRDRYFRLTAEPLRIRPEWPLI